MSLREWRESDTEMVSAWMREAYVPVDKAAIRLIVENGEGPVGAVAMNQFGNTAEGHIVVDPDNHCFKTASRVYDAALDEARRRGVRWLVGMIPVENRAAQMLAHRKGFRALSVVVMAKEL